MKTKIALLLLTAVMAFSLVSCGQSENGVPDGMQLVENEFVSYKLYIPDDWTPDLTTGITTAKDSDNSNFSVQMMTPSGSYKSADDYFRSDYFPRLASTMQNAVLLEEECSTENQTVGTASVGAVKYVYTIVSDSATYKIMQMFAVNGGYLYIFTYTANEAVFAEHLEEISSILKNFVF